MNNTIGDNNNDSGSQNTYGIAVDLRGDVQAVMNITGNIIRHTDQEGIFIQSRLDNAIAGDPSYALTLRNNTVANIDDNSAFPFVTLYGVRIESRNNTQLCLDIQDNSSTSVGGLEHFRVRQRDASIFRLERFGGVGTDENAVAGFIVGQNVIGSTASAIKSTTYTGVLDNFCSNY